jgi:hypothetical protein
MFMEGRGHMIKTILLFLCVCVTISLIVRDTDG